MWMSLNNPYHRSGGGSGNINNSTDIISDPRNGSTRNSNNGSHKRGSSSRSDNYKHNNCMGRDNDAKEFLKNVGHYDEDDNNDGDNDDDDDNDDVGDDDKEDVYIIGNHGYNEKLTDVIYVYKTSIHKKNNKKSNKNESNDISRSNRKNSNKHDKKYSKHRSLIFDYKNNFDIYNEKNNNENNKKDNAKLYMLKCLSCHKVMHPTYGRVLLLTLLYKRKW